MRKAPDRSGRELVELAICEISKVERSHELIRHQFPPRRWSNPDIDGIDSEQLQACLSERKMFLLTRQSPYLDQRRPGMGGLVVRVDELVLQD